LTCQRRGDGNPQFAAIIPARLLHLLGVCWPYPYLAAAGPLGELLGLHPTLLRIAGGGLLAFAAVVWLVASAQRMSRPAPATIVALNAAWAVGSVVAVLADIGTPTTAGAVWMIAQALVVAGFAELQLTGLRRAER